MQKRRKIDFDNIAYNLTAAMLSRPMHFTAVQKIGEKFYNLDNLDDSSGKQPFSTFKSAVISRETDDRELLVLDKRTADVRRAGAVQYALYTGSGKVGGLYEKYSGKSTNVNELLLKAGTNDYNDNILDDREISDVSTHSSNIKDASADTKDEKYAVPASNVMDDNSNIPNIDRMNNISDEENDTNPATIEKSFEGASPDSPGAYGNPVPDSDNSSEHSVPCKRTIEPKANEQELGQSDEDLESDNIVVVNDEEYILGAELLDNKGAADVDLRLRTFQDMGRLCRLYPGAYFDHDKAGWLCRKCQAFSYASTENPWISSGVNLGDHPIRKMNKHFESKAHKRSIETEKLLQKPSVHEMLKKHIEGVEKKAEIVNRSVLKTMLDVGLYMVKHRLPNDSFSDLLNPVADSGSEDVKKHLLGMAKNATYTSLHSFTELLQVMNEYVEKHLLEAAEGKWFTIFIDETTAVGQISVANTFIMFDDGKEVKEHYLGTVNMNTGLGLTAHHFYQAAKDLLFKKGLDIENCVFSEMDGCSTNQGRRKGLKKYFMFHNPHHISENCGSHKVALLPKKLIVEGPYQELQDADKIAVGLSAFFKESSLRTAILENTQIVLKHKVLKLISPASTRWLSHLNCSERLLQVLPSVLPALSSIYTEREDMKALGFMLSIIRPEFLLSCLAFHDVFKAMSLLIHWLQTAPSNADITRVPVLVGETVNKLLALAGEEGKECNEEEERKFTLVEFGKLRKIVDDFVQSTPIAGKSRNRRDAMDTDDTEAVFESFREEVFEPFAKEMAENIDLSLKTNPVCEAFSCLDVRNFPVKKDDLHSFGEEDLDILIQWYGAVQTGVYPGSDDQVSKADPVIYINEIKMEYKRYKNIMALEQKEFLKRKKKQIESIERQLDSIRKNRHSNRDKNKVSKLEKDLAIANSQEMSLNDAYAVVSNPFNLVLMPNIKKLVMLSALSPVGNAVVERLFSLMKITKTELRNRVGDDMLDMLLRLKVEAPDVWTEDDKEQLVELWVERKKRNNVAFRWKL